MSGNASAVVFGPAPIGGVNALGNYPAATLLLPYFEVPVGSASNFITRRAITPSPQNVEGDTLVTIGAATPTATLAHVTIHTDLGIPVFTFDIYLTGYDVVTFSVGALLHGILPQTASDGQDPADTGNPNDGISNQGLISQDINFASCTGTLPQTTVPLATIQHIQAALTGKFSQTANGCLGLDYPDAVETARGYITVDTVNACSGFFPNDPAYLPYLTFQNHLWGQYTVVQKGLPKYGDKLVAIRADNLDPLTTTAGNYTFYGSEVGFNATDRRQSLPTNFEARFVNNPQANGSKATSLIVWRDTKLNTSAFVCGTPPSFYPLGQESLLAFDDQENVVSLSTNPFPAATQKVRVGSSALPTTTTSGWLFLNLNTAVAGAPVSNDPLGVPDPLAAQAWVTTILLDSASVLDGIAQPATPLDSARYAQHTSCGLFGCPSSDFPPGVALPP